MDWNLRWQVDLDRGRWASWALPGPFRSPTPRLRGLQKPHSWVEGSGSPAWPAGALGTERPFLPRLPPKQEWPLPLGWVLGQGPSWTSPQGARAVSTALHLPGLSSPGPRGQSSAGLGVRLGLGGQARRGGQAGVGGQAGLRAGPPEGPGEEARLRPPGTPRWHSSPPSRLQGTRWAGSEGQI